MVVAIVPSRFHSSRFPGKALVAVAGEPLVALVVGRILASGVAVAFSRQSLGDPGQLCHLGIYAFTPASLRAFAALPRGGSAEEQGLEQLRALEHGMKIGVAQVRRATRAVNRPEDVSQVEAALG